MIFWSPAGTYVITRADVSGKFWIVRVLDFATWSHSTTEFATEALARTYADMWRI